MSVCRAISMSWSQVIDWIRFEGREPMVVAIAVRRESASRVGRRSRRIRRVWRLDEGADRRALIVADDEVAFPVPRLAAVGGGEWPLVDEQRRLGEPWATPARALVDAAMSPAGAQWAPVC